jgi:hypothetical protein
MKNRHSIVFVLTWCLTLSLSSQPLVVKRVDRLDAINSAAEELMPLLSNGGDTLYFTRVAFDWNVGGQSAGSDIWAAPYGGTLGKAINSLPPWNNRENNALIGIHTSGNTVYMLDGYGRHEGVAFSNKLRDSWTKPEVITIPGLSATGFKGYYMAPNYQVLMISMTAPDSYGEEDLYVSIKQPNGKWTKPKNLGATVNTSGYEISPFLTPDTKTLYFSSQGQGGLGGADIFMTQRLYDSWDVWTKPVNLGSPINSEGFDAYFSMYDSVAFFASTRQGGLSDLYHAAIEQPAGSSSANGTSGNLILNESEIVSLFGFIFDPLVEFEPGTDVLSAKDKELLWFVADKLSERPDVQVGLVSVGGGQRRQRSKAVFDYLTVLNLASDRLIVETGDGQSKTAGIEGIQLKFFKAK